MLPAAEGDEVLAALVAGFPSANIHLVEKDPVIARKMRTLAAGRRHPCYEMDVVEACHVLAVKGVSVSLLNLDLCGSVYSAFGKSTNERLREICTLRVLANPALVAVTVSVGRDAPQVWRQWPADEAILEACPAVHGEFSEREWRQLGILAATVRDAGYGVRALVLGKHRSRITMLWAIFYISKPA
jgi:hypothetical protein